MSEEKTFAEMAMNSNQEETLAQGDDTCPMMGKYVIAVDLDGTLAEYHGWKGMEHIGSIVPAVLKRMEQAYDEGKILFIFSARIDTVENAKIIKQWANDVGIAHMIEGYCNVKHKFFKEFWDDRAKQVIPNTGIFIEDKLQSELAETIKEGFAENSCTQDVPAPWKDDEEICARLGITFKALQVARLMSLPVFNYQHGGSHYKDMLIEPAVYVAANKLGAEEGNVIKYTSRHQFKNGEQDIDKAIHNLQMVKETRY